MNKIDKTLRDLGQLYDFYREIKKSRLKRSSPVHQASKAKRDASAFETPSDVMTPDH